MGNFEKLSVLVIVVIIVMILVVALYTWTGDPSGADTAVASVPTEHVVDTSMSGMGVSFDRTIKKSNDSAPKGPILTGEKKGLSAAQILEQFNKQSGRDGSVEVPVGMDDTIDKEAVDVPPVPVPVVAKEPRFHIVASGETIGKIAKLEYPGVGQKAIDGILKANPTVDPTRMAIGYKLLMPDLGSTIATIDGGRKSEPALPSSVAATIRPGTLYVTRKGDTLPNLANRAYRDKNQWHRIWVENFDDIIDTEHLQPGTRLKIPVL